MQMRRKDRQKDEQFARDLLGRCEYAVLSTVNEDGTPYGVPVSPVLEGNTVYFHCALRGQKIDNMGKNSAVCLSCVGDTRLVPEEFSTEYQSAVAVGTAAMVEDREEKIHALRLICEKYAASNLEAFDSEVNRSLKRTGICKVTLTEITGKAKEIKGRQGE